MREALKARERAPLGAVGESSRTSAGGVTRAVATIIQTSPGTIAAPQVRQPAR